MNKMSRFARGTNELLLNSGYFVKNVYVKLIPAISCKEVDNFWGRMCHSLDPPAYRPQRCTMVTYFEVCKIHTGLVN
ncbi:hypothetical protein SCA6_009176 [Theobroma cacao]